MEVGFRFAFILVALLAVSAYNLGRAYLATKMGKEKYEQLRSQADVIVRALEQSGLLQQLTGTNKKNIAMSVVGRAAEELGLDLGPDEISDLVESAVHVINSEAGKFDRQLGMAGTPINLTPVGGEV